MWGAERNIFTVIRGCPCVHLCGHTSQHFNILKKEYQYWCSDETDENIAEFTENCKKHGYQCIIADDSLSVWNETEKIEISADGKISIDGKPFPIKMQTNLNRKSISYPEKRFRKNVNVSEYKGSLGDKLAPCPFCKRKMVFYRCEWNNKYGKHCISQYYMHEPYDIDKEENCILDEINDVFVIGAGDADESTGYIGEYAEKWNQQLRKEKKS